MKEIKLIVDDRAGVIVVTAIGHSVKGTYINSETIELEKLKDNTYKMLLFKE